MNRMIQARREAIVHPTAPGVEKMFRELEIFEAQLNDWYISLPPSISFPLPTGTIQPLQDELTQLLRARYLSIRELCYRPFVQLATSLPLHLPAELFEKVTKIASQGLQYCAFRLQAIPPQSRHHGLWFQLPNSTTCALILLAADRASYEPTLNAIPHIEMPPGWHAQILATRDLLAGYWKDRRGGIWDCFQILQWALDGCSIGSLTMPK